MSRELPLEPSPFGAYVTEALSAYDEWISSDGDDDTFVEFQTTMEQLRGAVARLIDKEMNQ